MIIRILFILLSTYLWITVIRIICNKEKTNFKKLEYKPKVSILIPAHNEERTIKETLASLQLLDYSNFEIILVAHNCKDKTKSIAETIENVVVLEYNEGDTKGAALNYAMNFVTGEYILVIDSDTLVPKDFLKIVMGKLINEKFDALQTWVRIKNKDTNILTKNTDYEFVIIAEKQIYLSKKGKSVLGGNGQIVSKKALQDVNYWTHHLTDDTELTLRLQKKKYRIGFTKDTYVSQEAIPEFSGYVNQRVRWAQGNMSLLLKVIVPNRFLFFEFCSILLIPLITLYNCIFFINLIKVSFMLNKIYNFNNGLRYILLEIFLIIPYIVLLVIIFRRNEIPIINILSYYLYIHLLIIIFFKMIIRIIKKEKNWIKTKHGF